MVTIMRSPGIWCCVIGYQFPGFQKNTVPSSLRVQSSCSSQTSRPLKTKASCSFKTWGTTWRKLWHHIQKNSPQPHNLQSHYFTEWYVYPYDNDQLCNWFPHKPNQLGISTDTWLHCVCAILVMQLQWTVGWVIELLFIGRAMCHKRCKI
jgi:hypothetical protein